MDLRTLPNPLPESPKENASGPSTFDYITKLAVPVLALVTLIATQSQQQPALTWGLLGLAFLSVLVGFYPQAAPWLKRRREARRDERLARREFAKLRQFVEDFGRFVNNQGGDSLEYVLVHEVFQGRTDKLSGLGLPSANLFQGFWSNLSQDVATEKPSLAAFRTLNSDLSMLVSLYSNFCYRPIFENPPQDFRSQLTDSYRSSLNACRERFVTFLNQYSYFLKSLDAPFAERYVGQKEFDPPKPL